MLTDPARTRPVVFVSAANWDDKPQTDGASLADWLAGIAHVWVAENRFPSQKMKAHLPERLNCWDGAVRVYWPGFSRFSNPYDHDLWTAQDVREADQNRQGFKEHLLGVISAATAYVQDPEAVAWTDVEAVRRSRLLEELRNAGDDKALLEIYSRDNDSKVQRIAELERQVAELARTRDDAQRLYNFWRQQYVALQEGRSADLDSTTGDSDHLPASVKEAIETAEGRFQDRLVFVPNGKSEIKNNPFERAGDLYRALEFLATEYWESKSRGIENPGLAKQLTEKTGFQYQANQSAVTIGRYREWYEAKWQGRTIQLKKHIRLGSSKDARYTIRVAFEWDVDRKLIVVGYVGQHQETDAS